MVLKRTITPHARKSHRFLFRFNEVFDGIPLAAGLEDAYTDRIHIGIKNVGAMVRRLHELGMNVVSIVPFGNVFGQPGVVHSSLSYTAGEARLSRKLMGKSALLRHLLGMFARGAGERIVPLQGWQSLFAALTVRGIEESTLNARTVLLAPTQRNSNRRQEQDHNQTV